MGNELFDRSTRLRRKRYPTLTRAVGGGVQRFQLDQVGVLSRIYLKIAGSIAGTLSAPNAGGMASVVRQVRVAANTGLDIINLSGIGYHWLVRDFIDLFSADPTPEATARNAVTATTFDVSMVIPISLNNREQIGDILLQNRDTQLTVEVDFEADATVATGATVTATVVPTVEYFEVPNDPKAFPDVTTVHRIIEESKAIGGAGDDTYRVPEGGVLTGLYQLCVGSTWTRAILRAQSGNILEDHVPESMEQVYNAIHGRGAALTGGAITGRNVRVLWDFLGSDGLGAYGSVRDVFDTARLTALESIVSIAGASTLRTVRRELVPLGA